MTGIVMVNKGGGRGSGAAGAKGARGSENEQNQLSMAAIILEAIRKSVSCSFEEKEDVIPDVHHLEIGWPTNVQHITHVTFDRFNGFLGLPVEFEVEIPRRVPSASASVFGVSAESMQCTFDSRGNSIPTILLLMQERLYSQGGLKAEGIFRINPENGQEEHVRDQLNRGIVPDDIDQLKPTESALLNWAIDLMTDVVQEENSNKMNARNIAMIFAPNMTQMSDPLTALMHAVQVMNLLKTLITKTLREREETETGGYSPMSFHSSGQQTDEDFESQQEMDTSCELRQAPSDHYEEDRAHYSPHNEDDDETESLIEIEDCFLRPLDENRTGYIFFQQAPADLPREFASPGTCSAFKVESGISFTDSRSENSSSATSDGEDSRESMIAVGQEIGRRSAKGCENSDDVKTVDKLAESVLPTQSII
ncbi:hypothetical protein GH714_037240 [Hevea brasiliensis]|uniref:CRIB domain-containing protein n=1 Tax=Hevea brasiliensis TaxID=3981 RepID=A0A6A6MRY0_HEVBR|nr:hypothetical protein GH714_037240 [Hevea brasiliensis]